MKSEPVFYRSFEQMSYDNAIYAGNFSNSTNDIDLADLPSAAGAQIASADSSSKAGERITTGDINGDLVDDLIILAPKESTLLHEGIGVIYVLWGGECEADHVSYYDLW